MGKILTFQIIKPGCMDSKYYGVNVYLYKFTLMFYF